MNLELNVGIRATSNRKYGRTSAFDIQMRQYRKHILLDIFLQKYNGFYYKSNAGNQVSLLPDMSMVHIGTEANVLLNSQLNGKAAWGLFEKQNVSAGSVVVGAGLHYFMFTDSEFLLKRNVNFTNIQIGSSTGYAYSWVINKKVLWSSLATGGIGIGYTPDKIEGEKLYARPIALGRSSIIYHYNDWESAFSMIIHTKPIQDAYQKVDMTSLYLRMYVVRYIQRSRK